MIDKPHNFSEVPLSDLVNIELDRRKLENRLNVTTEPFITVATTNYDFDPNDTRDHEIVGITCGSCGFKCDTMKQIENHMLEHLKSDKLEQ